jgi:uncharacterized protein (DUF934 family)
MPLLKSGQIVEDTWLHLDDEHEMPVDGDVIVSLERWFSEEETLRAHNGKVGIRLKNDQSPAQVADDLDAFDAFILEFPKYTDGRAYSAARLLRDRYGFTGEVRASGDVLIDQYGMMQRCGFNAYEIDDSADAAAWQSAEKRISSHYQPAADGVAAIWAKRHKLAKSA